VVSLTHSTDHLLVIVATTAHLPSQSHCILVPLPPLKALLDPCLVSRISALDLLRYNTFEHFAREADKVVPAQGVFEPPVAALLVLALEGLGIANLLGGVTRIAHHGQHVEPDLGAGVREHAVLQHLRHLVRELFGSAGAVRDGRGLQPVELVQLAVDGRIGNEVEGVLSLACLLCLIDEGAALGEAVVHFADQIRVAEGLAAEFGRQNHGKVAEL
ncbi:hypothetical protein CSPAE12_04692, partial [Colletotrichum incanum]